MKKLLLFFALFFLILADIQAAKPKRYGFTASFRVPRATKEVLLDSTLSWIRENLPTSQFYLRDINETESYVTYRATNKGDFGKVSYDLTFYTAKNVVDMVVDNVEHSRNGRLPREFRSKGTPKRKTKKYLSSLSKDLGQYLRDLKNSRSLASSN
ncbi:hypothetical protein AAE02nite_19540 [Adhaeribacter aerolatus]|uniref:DUF4468 domain-containing protein n=1 Tax=Adhaeribacter aerolatus TaxID=670289 RepID=A0A512AX81_9BACT|nr:hypothetical protein [Adhaeribacter aerolatus]GEO04290.1 hypothetical protein AAE02nite_19540 [Adhaeribacter aerolatus]